MGLCGLCFCPFGLPGARGLRIEEDQGGRLGPDGVEARGDDRVEEDQQLERPRPKCLAGRLARVVKPP